MIRELALLFIICVAALGCRPVPALVPIPAVEDVESATVILDSPTFGPHDGKRRKLGDEDIRLLINHLSPAMRRETDIGFAYMGTVEITMANGNQHVLRLFDAGQNPIEFEIDGVRCVRNGPYDKTNRITGEMQTFWPNESINLFHYLREIGG